MPICIAGHAGIGHVFSHSGFVQDDTQGFVLLAGILAEEHGLNLGISEIKVMNGKDYLQVGLRSGGRGVAHPRRGCTPQELALMERLVGRNALFVQECVLYALGRIYGNGVLEVPVSLEYALCEAIMESLADNINGFVIDRDKAGEDLFGGVPTDLADVPVTFLLSVNGNREGLGPCEDREGNVSLGAKKRVMEKLGVIGVPTVIVESKAYNPTLEHLDRKSYMVRYNEAVDNQTVGGCLASALKSGGFPGICQEKAFPFTPGTMRRQVESAGARLVQLGEELARSSHAVEKVRIIGEAARFVSEDLGGVVFMSDRVHDQARSAGTMPGTSAVLSSVVPRDYINTQPIPYVVPEDLRVLKEILEIAIPGLSRNLQEACGELRRKSAFFSC